MTTGASGRMATSLGVDADMSGGCRGMVLAGVLSAASCHRSYQSLSEVSQVGGWCRVCGRRPDDIPSVSSRHAALPSFPSSRYSGGGGGGQRIKTSDDVNGGFDVVPWTVDGLAGPTRNTINQGPAIMSGI